MENQRVVADLVIGSGPTGYAAALALSHVGRVPVVVDFGETPNVEQSRIHRRSTAVLKGDGERARVFDYPTDLVESHDGKQLPLSSARGGLSTIWGAGILVRNRTECTELDPVFDGLEEGYRALLGEIPVVGCDDRLSVRFPWPIASSPGPTSARYTALLRDLDRRGGDVLVGHARAAIDASGDRCVRCGLCLRGCPRKLFFSAGVQLSAMASVGRCELISGPVVRLDHGADLVRVQLAQGVILAERVYLALGPVATPALLQRSGLAPDKLVVRDSAVFYTALINTRERSGDESEYTASQATIYSEMSGSDDFQLSLYESNPEYSARLSALVPGVGRLLRIPKGVAGRLNAGIGFLDSSVSGRLELTYASGRSTVTRHAPSGLRTRSMRVMSRVGSMTSRSGLRPIPGFVLIPPPGSGYHSGASLPMGSDWVDFDGALRTAPRISIVDASSLPKVWAGSHTFTAMANAYRIGRLSAVTKHSGQHCPTS